MPKSIRKTKKDGYWTKVVVPTKFRIGNRKTGTSANLMSNEDLEKVLANNDQARYWSNAKAVLMSRYLSKYGI